jgi:hypothetical protein
MNKLFKIVQNIWYILIPKKYTDLEEAIREAEKVKKIRLWAFDIDINSYAKDFLKFQSIKNLYIQTDIAHVSFLPKEIGELKTLKKLEILNVPFLEFPEWIENLENLEYLMVRGCEITVLPSFIGKLQKLKVLRIENCELSSIPKELALLTNLKELSIVITPIRDIPLAYLPQKLKYLHLFQTHIGNDINNIKFLISSLPNTKITSHILHKRR